MPSASRRWFGVLPSIPRLLISSASPVAGDGEEGSCDWVASSSGPPKSGTSDVSDGVGESSPYFTARFHMVLRRWTLRGGVQLVRTSAGLQEMSTGNSGTQHDVAERYEAKRQRDRGEGKGGRGKGDRPSRTRKSKRKEGEQLEGGPPAQGNPPPRRRERVSRGERRQPRWEGPPAQGNPNHKGGQSAERRE